TGRHPERGRPRRSERGLPDRPRRRSRHRPDARRLLQLSPGGPMSNNIVIVNVSQQVASTPSTLQRTGAFVSQGATTLTTGSTQLISQLADLTAILKTP